MVFFYEAKDEHDLSRVERILRQGGIEYFLRDEPLEELGPKQIHVAEEDVPAAEALLLKAETQH